MQNADIERALLLEAEASEVDFKSRFDPSHKGELLEIVKDIAAMANSGGGVVLFGLNNDGSPSGADLSALRAYDSAKLTDAIYKYTDCQFQDFRLCECQKLGRDVVALTIGTIAVPMVFSQTGNYQDANKQQRNAFVGGTVYFRHGTKSEPGNSDDLRQFIERRLEVVRRAWLEGIAVVVEAPPGSVFQIVDPASIHPGAVSGSREVRLTNDPAAPAVSMPDIDVQWPFRQKEVVAEVNRLLDGERTVKGYNIQCARKAHDIDADPVFCYRQKHASAKFSRAFVDWLVGQFHADQTFFEKSKSIADAKTTHAAPA
jgi:hypothetical protein